ncbi:Cytoplasmic dynein 2 heavy chain [Dirofilaria immitis]
MNTDYERNDPRRHYILRVASHIFALNLSENKIPDLNPIQNFCNTTTPLLIITRDERKNTFNFTNEIRNDHHPDLTQVIFYKPEAIALSSDNYKSKISVLSLRGRPTDALIRSVREIFKRTIENNSETSVNSHLRTILNELEMYIEPKNVWNIRESFREKRSVHDEINYWKARKDNAALQYSQVFQILDIKLEMLMNCRINEISEVIDTVEDCLNQLWNCEPTFPQNRMEQIVHSIGSLIINSITNKIEISSIWNSGTTDTLVDTLHTIISLCEQWKFGITTLIEQWKQDIDNPWKGDKSTISAFEILQKHTDKILSLKLLSNQINELMEDRNGRKEMEQIIRNIFGTLPIFASDISTQKQWEIKLLEAERSIEPIVERVLPVLRKRLQFNQLTDDAATANLIKFKHFLNCPTIKEKLSMERETLLSRLANAVEMRKHEITERIAINDIPIGQYLTEIAAKLIWIRREVNKIENIRIICDELLNDLAAYKTVKAKILSIIDEIRSLESDSLSVWCQEMIEIISNSTNSVALETNGKLMSIEQKGGNLIVNYSDRLVRLLREVRQLIGLGFVVPRKIIECANTGEQFYKYAIILKQVAHFYNSVDQQMLPCQQAMMLDEALAFEKLILSGKKGETTTNMVSWNNPKHLQEFIGKLQAAAERLTLHNRQLRKAHSEICDKIKQLTNLDLLKEINKWKDVMGEIRSKIAEQERNIGNRSNMIPWLLHWDRQLYKALQLQYQCGVESLHTQIPLIQVQLMFRDQQFELRPPLEEIRAKYYRELRKFISIPQKFRSVQETEQANELFAKMIERNANRFWNVYAKAEQLFEKLVNVGNEFENFVVLGQVDLESLIAKHFKQAADWENQIKLLKGKGRDAEKLPNEIRLECILVSTSAIKNSIDDILQRLFDTLIWTLRYSINNEIHDINHFLNQAIEALSSRPQSVDEIAEANQNHILFGKASKEMKRTLDLIEEKNVLLRSVGGSGTEQLPTVLKLWEKFELMLDSHQLMIKDQVETLKSNVTTRLKSLNGEIEKLFVCWKQFKPKNDIFSEDRNAMLGAIQFIKEKRDEFDNLQQKRDALLAECNQLDIEKAEMPFFDEMASDLKNCENNWLLYEQFNAGLQEMANEKWILFRSKTYRFDEYLHKWDDELKNLSITHITARLRKDIDQFKEMSSGLKYCRGEILSSDHWLMLFRILGMPKGTTLEHLRFGDFLNVHKMICENLEALKNLNERAQGEITIREAIQELELWAQQAEFVLTDYKHSNGTIVKIIKDWKDILNSVKDSEALLQSLKNSSYYSQFTDKTSIWETRLADTEQYLQWMNEIQRKWIYLEPIFGRGSLPSEASRFNRVDVEFRIVLNDVVQDPRIVSLSTRASLKRTLEQIIDQLNRCQKALNQFLEEKRSAFPRFYFLGDDDLLEMLGQLMNATVIQAHLKKLFLGIHKAVFGSNDETIVAIVSSDGEIVQLSKAVRIVPQAEKWLQELSNEMKNTIRKLIIKCVAETSPDPGKYPSQVLCLSEQIRFCEGCERILNGKGDLQSYRKQLKQTLANYINSEISDQVLKLKLKALIMDVIHNISILDELIDNSPCFISSWVWQKQLRFYLESQEYVVIRHIGARFDYTYEYQGNAPKLVHTPLTDKCYLTLTQAMSMGFGGNLYGPAGTGKTESVKALANLFGRQVLVFNCDEGIDVYSMIRIFIGLVQCGAWGCFDEFNRLDQTVLSAVSMQIQVIQDAIMSRSEKCMLADREVPVDLNSAIFITLNPVSKAYGGRQKLPDNLMQLFRPIVMSAPDNELIAETLLSAEGFCDAKKLSRKLVSIFSLSKEMLSSQQHYDWGLRALKTVLCSCGNLLASRVDKNENQVVVDALTLNTISKLTFEDSKRFSILIDDIFSDVKKDTMKIEELLEPLKFVASELKITITDMQIKKIFELYDQMRQRMGVILLGPSGSGKSTIWKVLQKALTLINKPVKTYWINPKSMAKQKLLGYMDMRTREWSDGVLTVAAREVVKDSSVLAWIICDGDIDPEWIEALNSVLDDNRLLTMPSGERIQFGSNVNFIFETDNLSSASPATISRMGMVLVSEQDMDIQELINNWLKEHNDVHPAMSDWIRDHLYRCLDWIWTKGVIEIVVSKTAMVQNALSHARDVTSNDEFLVALYRGLAPNLNPKSRNQFAAEVVFNEVKLPVKQNPRNIYYDKRARSLSTYTDEMDISNSNDQLLSMERIPYILTANAQANRDTICSWLDNRNRQPFIIYGPDGSGKESLLRYCLKLDPNSQIALLHCSAQTGSQQVLDLLHQYCIQIGNASGRVLKPKEKQNLILYIKGINIVKPDKWGFCEIIAFLQQLLTYGGYYNEKLEWISLENIQLVLSITLANDEGHYLLPSRFVSLLRICTVEYPTQEELITIYSSYLTFLIKDSMEPLRRRLNDLAIIMVRLFNDVRNTFKPTDKAHYVFTLKDLSNWVFNLTRYDITGTDADEKFLYSMLYECRRIFKDRLANNEHKQKFEDIISNNLSSAAVHNNENNLYVSGRGALSMTTLKGAPLSLIPRKEYAKLLQQAVLTHEFEVANFKMPIFDGFVNLCSQIDRVITASGGSLLLAGRAGMGRREAASLVANIHQMPVLSPRITSSYGIKQFRNDLKTVIQDAAINDKHIVYIIEDYQLLHDTFLQSINSLLSSGDLPGLFTVQEFDSFLVSLREQASQDAFQGDLYSYFVMKVKTNLHIILILNIDDANFAIRCSSNPSLYKECSIIWNETWNKDALSQLSELILSQHHVKAANDILIAFGQIYHSCPPEIAPPAKYIRLIENYVCILNKKRTAIEIRSNRLKAGISKLTEARESVSQMQKKAAKKSKLLAEKQTDADMALKAISQSMTNANYQRSDMEQLKLATAKENERIEKQKSLIEEQLREVEPLLREAREAVGSIKSESLSEIRSLRAPPEAIRDILQAVLLFMGIFDTSWEAMRKFLARNGVKDEIINFDARRISPDVNKKVSTLIKSKQLSFDPKNAKRASAAAAPLAAWVQANLDYSTILERVAPLQKEKNDLIKNLNKAEKQMEKLSKGLETVDERVIELKNNFEETIGVAETLIDRLSGEYERWQDQISNLQNELNCLEKGSLLSAAFVTFLGSESEQVRNEILYKWKELLNLSDFSILEFNVMETEKLNWSNKGLPTDALSQENAMILFNTIEIPLIIDPSGRASSFLEKHLKAKQVELAVRFGKFLLIDNVDKIEPTLINLLRKDFSSQGPRNVVQIGEKTVDYNDSFRLYICSKNNSLRLDQTAKATIALICFSITQTGLASQMLGLAIQIEKPILETRLNELTSNVEQMKIKLDGIEQSLLQALASSEGSLLSNMDLLDSLNKSKENAETIAISLVEADKLQRQLVKEKNIYRPLAEAASSLYFIIHDLHKQNPMYSFNINTVINLYSRTFSKVKESTDATGRMEKLRRILQHSVYEYVSRALFKKDRLMFSMRFIHGIQPSLFAQNEWELFTGSIVDDDTIHPVEKINWIGSERKAAVAKLQKHLPILFNNLRFTDEGLWREFARTLNCEKTFPPAIDAIMTPFQKLLVIQAIRPERLYPAMISFVVNILGVPSINPSPLDLSSVYKSESNSNEPIMILISPSADPSQELEELARKQISIAKFYQISMGQGQRQVALEAIRTCSAKGGWVCLKNLHLAIDDIAEIEKEFLTSKRDPSFRLWLTSESNEHFSPQLLQTSLKIVYEAPPGIKNNMKRIYAQWQQSEINFSAVCLQSLFILAWLHALLQERRMFIPQAWSKFYEFNNSDLRVARKFVENVTRDNKIVDWQLIHGLMQTVAYGGRIDNDFDMNVLNVYLKRYFNPSIIGTNGAEIAQNISIPFSSNITDYINVININIPEEDNPSLFGLPSNISTAREMAETINTIRQIRSMQIVGTTEVTFDRNVWNKALNPILTLWKRLNSQSTLHSMNVPSAQHTDDPILEIISLEYVHAITLVQKVHKFLGAVSKCLRGIQMLTPEIAINARTLMMHQTPEEWQEAWIGPSDPAQYLSALVHKAKSIEELSHISDSHKILKNPIKLGCIFRPAAFFNALRQLTARKKHLFMDELKLATAWNASFLKNENIMEISGIHIQGALFEEHIVETKQISPTLTTAPNLYIAWISANAPDVYEKDKSIFVPLYATPERNKLIAEVQMPCTKNPERWIIASVALFLSS